MNKQPRKFKKGDVSDERPGLLFVQYKNGREYWTNPKQFARHIEYQNGYYLDWQRRNRAKCKQARDKWREKPGSVEKAKAAYDRWVKTPEGRKVKRAIYARHLATINGTMSNRLRSRLLHAIKNKAQKSDTTYNLVGCSLSFLKSHISSQFTEGMTWEKFMSGDIHLDHKLPLAMFDLSKPDQQRIAFHFENLQPLWRSDNQRKCDRIIVDGQEVKGRDIRKIIPFKAA